MHRFQISVKTIYFNTQFQFRYRENNMQILVLVPQIKAVSARTNSFVEFFYFYKLDFFVVSLFSPKLI